MRQLLVIALALGLGCTFARAGTYSANVLYPLLVPGDVSIHPRRTVADGTVGYETLTGTNPPDHALRWLSPDGGVTDLNPTDLGDVSFSSASETFAGQQVGSFGGAVTGGFSRAVLWSGTPASAVDLNPTNLQNCFASLAVGTDAIHQVGKGFFGTPQSHTQHALLWAGTSDSAIDLNPDQLGAIGSVALGVNGQQQVGDFSTASTLHAVLWNGTAASAVDLHPDDPSLTFSDAVGTNGTQQVGAARSVGGDSQAFLWTGTADSAVNLNPTTLANINASFAVATNGLQQVGSGYDGSATVDDDHAMVWSGTADSATDLDLLLPSSGSWAFSDATTIDDNGDIFGTANGTYNGVSGYFAVEWAPVPEPSSVGILLVFTAIAHSGRRRRRDATTD